MMFEMKALEERVMKTSRILAIGIAALAAIAGCGHQEKPAAAVEQTPVAVQVASVEAAQVPVLIKTVGSTEPYARTTLSTRLMGRIKEVAVDEGAAVHKGQMLVRIESQDLTAKRRQAEAGLKEAKAVLTNAEKNVERMRNLYKEQAVPQQQLDGAETGLARAQAGVSAAEQMVREVEVNLGYSEVKSQLDGVVVQKFAQPGDMAAPGMPLMAVEQQDSMKVTVEINERDQTYVAVGQEVDVEIEALKDEPLRRGRVEALVPAANPGSRTFQVRVVVPNVDRSIGSGMFARVGFPKGMRPALLVPVNAVVREGQLRGVYAVVDGKARLRWVRLGRILGEKVEVLSGLEAGVEVVVGDKQNLRDGRPVKVGRPVEVKGNA
jgi:membrane fusion protein, multidrug efflux system